MTSRWLTFGVRPPERQDDRVEVLRFLRDLMIRSLVLTVLGGVVVFAVVEDSTWEIVMGALIALTALDVVFLTWRLRREERK